MTRLTEYPALRDIGVIIRDAVIFKFQPGQNSMADDSLLRSVSDLFALLKTRNIPYVLVGGVAMLQYVEGRNTEDIDLIMAVASLRELPEIAIDDENEFFAQGRLGALKIDFLLTRNKLFELVSRSYVATKHFVEQDVPCATIEGLLLLKLYALPSLYRQGNFVRVNLYEGDIAALMQAYRPDMQALLTLLASYLNDSDAREVRAIVAETQERIDRFTKSSGQ
jgi:hypothetical protein